MSQAPVTGSHGGTPKLGSPGESSGIPNAAAFSTGLEGSTPSVPCATGLTPGVLPTPPIGTRGFVTKSFPPPKNRLATPPLKSITLYGCPLSAEITPLVDQPFTAWFKKPWRRFKFGNSYW